MDGTPVLADHGLVDADVPPYNLLVPAHGWRRFSYRNGPAELDYAPDYCYPFHAACWSLLQESLDNTALESNTSSLYNVFETFQYSRQSRCLIWGMDYEMANLPGEDACGQKLGPGSIAANKCNNAFLADPLLFRRLENHHKCRQYAVDRRKMPQSVPHMAGCSRLRTLPPEIFDTVLCYLSFSDIQNLELAIDEGNLTLSKMFWHSRFLGSGEAAFARSICPPRCTWEAWFFQLTWDMASGPNKSNLLNRQRIWKLGAQLSAIVHVVQDPDRALCGEVIRPSDTGCSVSCAGLQMDSHGCQELKQVYVNFGEKISASRICGVVASYFSLSHLRLISGLTFTLNNGQCIDTGYVINGCRAGTAPESTPQFMWLIFSPLGLEWISLGEYPLSYISHRTSRCEYDLAITRWPLDCITAISLGLDVGIYRFPPYNMLYVPDISCYSHCASYGYLLTALSMVILSTSSGSFLGLLLCRMCGTVTLSLCPSCKKPRLCRPRHST